MNKKETEELVKKLIDNGHKEIAEMFLSGLPEKPKGRSSKAMCCRFLPWDQAKSKEIEALIAKCKQILEDESVRDDLCK